MRSSIYEVVDYIIPANCYRDRNIFVTKQYCAVRTIDWKQNFASLPFFRLNAFKGTGAL